ncbi:glycoside hydrolase family 43 protein [Actinoplanes utahensis]|uniref:glycoside hydrolase family 43 protein n=1 Tax=Actinoplanes utahensis TaxID=1869 RepID=UPI00068ED6B0|nr:glycoside hydrolase family 43 protein [Actinoplanes utahensis]GIF27276.1 hypothetical protein Aut01nite_02620 [Actinoplanes utahensis]
MNAENTVPVIAGFFPDPSICRSGDDYYVVCSSFEYAPGVPIFHSRDLYRWEQIGNVLAGPVAPRPSQGVYAPTIRYHDGRFWMITTDVGLLRDGHLITHAERPEGPWSEPVHVAGTLGIDPDLAWDDDGNCYLTYASFQEGGGIVQLRVDPETGTALSDTYLVWRGTDMQNTEAPHLYQVDGYWYLLVAEGGTERGHAVTIARGPAPQGPFEGCPANPILSHRSTGHPVQNTGHADLVRSADGSWFAVLLGVRPRGFTPGYHVNGRETFLARVEWRDGWPVFLDPEPAVTPADHSFTDDFTGPALHPRWVSPGDGLLCVRARDAYWTAEATVDRTALPSRLVLRLDDRHWYGLTLDTTPADVGTSRPAASDIAAGEIAAADINAGRTAAPGVATPKAAAADIAAGEVAARGADAGHVAAGRVDAVARIGDLEQVTGSVRVTGDTVTLRISAVEHANASEPNVSAGPDQIVLSADGIELARLDGRYLSTEVAGGFTGRVIGVAGARRFSYTTEGPQ